MSPLSRSPDDGIGLEGSFKTATQICERAKCPRTYANERAAVTLSLSDDDFAKLVSGKTQAQRLFMSGKLKVKGDVMKVGHGSSPVLKSPPITVMVGYEDGASA